MIDAAGGQALAVQTLGSLSIDGLAISIIAIAEIYEGAFGSPEPALKLADFRDFLRDYAILPATDPIAERFAGLRAHFRKQGQLIPDLDLLIGSTALHHDLTLLTRNVRHFGRVPGLRLYRPSDP